MNDLIDINVQIDLKALKETVEKAQDLEDNEQLFNHLADVRRAQDLLGEAADLLKSVDAEAKAVINAKAKALYGPEWSSISGDGYKINRSATGALYEIADVEKAGDDFVEVEFKPKSKAIKDYVKSHSELPEGIAVNPDRGEAIKITVKGDA